MDLRSGSGGLPVVSSFVSGPFVVFVAALALQVSASRQPRIDHGSLPALIEWILRQRCDCRFDILRSMRLSAIAAVALLSGCASAPPPSSSSQDGAEPAWYGQTVDQLAGLNRAAEQAFHDGKADQAAAMIERGQPLVTRLLSVPRPSLAAAEAASDLDDLYGRMLLSNRHYAWAITFFEKNRARWKNWAPQTPETARRLKQAEAGIEECDRHMAE